MKAWSLNTITIPCSTIHMLTHENIKSEIDDLHSFLWVNYYISAMKLNVCIRTLELLLASYKIIDC